MRAKFTSLVLAVALLLMPNMGTAAEARRFKGGREGKQQQKFTLPVTGTFRFTETEGTGIFRGTLFLERFAERDNKIMAIGTVKGSLLNAAGSPLGREVVGQVAMPVTIRSAEGIIIQQESCEILNLTLGGVDLNLLGVVVTLSDIVLDISAEEGGVLGNLICTILEAVGNVVDLLNALLGLLGGLTG